MSAVALLRELPARHRVGEPVGIISVCSAHPLVIEAALGHAREEGFVALIESTCNQVNQEGGYTGMDPAAFRRFVEGIAAAVGFDAGRLILGGDHLGPNPWKSLPPAEAMARAAAMVRAYVEAGFTKIHLDTSMGCRGEPAALPDGITAQRAAALARVAESAAEGAAEKPAYVIGTEVPIPGGALEALGHLKVTRPEAVRETVEVHRRAFAALGLEAAFARIVGVVVQPGVEFGSDSVHVYDPAAARPLAAALGDLPGMVFEAHSTDYQPAAALAALVRDGFAILKVGPQLTFALREALYGLDHIAAALGGGAPPALRDAMEALMQAEPGHWQAYYHGDAAALFVERHFSYSDRIRYYWPAPQAVAAVDALLAKLAGRPIPPPVISQYLGALAPAVAAGALAAEPRALILANIRRVLADYAAACRP